MFAVGQVVRATAGGEKGKLFAVISCDEMFAFISDGKRHRTDNPKKKSFKHIEPLDITLTDENLTDKKLRKALERIKKSLP